MKPSFTLGIEEEYQTVDPDTRDLRSHIHAEIIEKGKLILQERVKAGAFVPVKSVLESSAFQDVPNSYFGGQKTGAVLAQAAASTGPGWQYPPFFEWARSIYGDISSPLYTSGKGSLEQILDTWRQRCITYGNEQGFKVS